MIDGIARNEHLEPKIPNQSLVDWVDDIIFSVDCDGRFTALNANTMKRLGIEPQDIIGKKITNFFSLDESGFFLQEIERIVQTGRPSRFERHSTNPLGEFWFSISLNPIVGANGSIVGVSGIFHDITERRKVEEALRRRVAQQEALNAVITAAASASNLNTLVETTLDQVVNAVIVEKGIIWAAGRINSRGFPQTTGESMKEITCLFNMGVDELILVNDFSLLDGDDSLPALKSFAFKFDIRSILIFPILLNGQEIGGLALASGSARHWEKDEIALLKAISLQVGAVINRLGLLEKTHEQAQQVEQLVHTVPEGVVLLDAKGKIILANPAAKAALAMLSNVKPGDTLVHLGGRPRNEFLTSPPFGLWHEVEKDNRIFEIYTKPTEVGPVTSSWVLVIRDVTDEREIRKRTQQQERLAAIGQLAAGIAHDFNNIMAVILLYSQISLRSQEITSSLRERLQTIELQSKRATELIQQIMDFSRSAVLDKRAVDLAPFMKEFVKLLKRTLPENIQIILDVDTDEYPILADPTRIQQAVMNLAFNARDAMPDGGKLYFRIEKVNFLQRSKLPFQDMEKGEWIKVDIIDTGSGIPEEHITHVFEPFYTTKKPGLGTGLGLAQVYGIVSQHAGFIDVESSPANGTIFTIYFPILVNAEKQQNNIDEQRKWPVGHGETILVIEDDPVTRQALAEGLEALKYKVIEAQNGNDALTILQAREQEVSLIVSDVVMPEMGGKALLNALYEQNIVTKTILMTGHPLSEEGFKLGEKGLVELLQKPVDLYRLAVSIEKALSA